MPYLPVSRSNEHYTVWWLEEQRGPKAGCQILMVEGTSKLRFDFKVKVVKNSTGLIILYSRLPQNGKNKPEIIRLQ
jgi:hypothetical protein